MTDSKVTGWKPYLPIIIVFSFVSAMAVVFSAVLVKKGIDTNILIGGNIVLFLVTLLSYWFNRKAIFSGNTQAFLRNFYSGMFVKFFACLIAAFCYIYFAGKAVNIGALFSLMFLYMVYTIMEISGVLRQSDSLKTRPNG